jgi:hypothetical protein
MSVEKTKPNYDETLKKVEDAVNAGNLEDARNTITEKIDALAAASSGRASSSIAFIIAAANFCSHRLAQAKGTPAEDLWSAIETDMILDLSSANQTTVPHRSE